ncbi:very long-chain specific acyl-CoA dehydrogenase, mitochondrial-like [Choristoneura fumiferana]|uniref:very long-chain specific acyl-CoA dehydrogenase, mitochondrial-like n=1 Tax=Choristoneura fumiferana TaxID=7141 RepID=UPI003D1566C1
MSVGARRLASAAAAKKERPGPAQSDSFTLNLFRGALETATVFPYPEPLQDDQRQALQELVPPVEKFSRR